MASKRHLQIKTVKEECKALKYLENSNISNKHVSPKYSLSKNTTSRLKNKEKILADLEKLCTNNNRKKMRTGAYGQLHKAIF